ncbi:MAG: nucleoside hydrolase [Terricaulis sp.]
MTPSRRDILATAGALAGAGALGACGGAAAAKTPVIFNTDIGGDIDDAWALLMLLRAPALDLKLVSTDGGNTLYRARVAARILEVAGRAEIPIGIGLEPTNSALQQAGWLGDYDITRYPGYVHEDGAAAIIDTILNAPTPVTVISVGPAPTLASALAREPRIAENARFVGMHGSIRRGMPQDAEAIAEWNVKVAPAALRAIFAAPWQCTITPLDTCGQVVLDGADYAAVRASSDPYARSIIEQYEDWRPRAEWLGPEVDPARVSSTLFDCVAVQLAFDESLLEIETLPLVVTDDGFTRIDAANGRNVRCATSWRDLAAFKAQVAATFAQGA